MAERPRHIHNALEALRTYTGTSVIAYGDLGQVSGYLARLERRVDQLERLRPSLWRRIRTRLEAWRHRRADRRRIEHELRGLGR